MQGAGDTSSRLVSEPEPTRTGLSPAIAFLLLLALIGLVGIGIFLLRPDPVPPTQTADTNSEPSFALTNAEAIARFEQLNEMRLMMYETRDVSLADQFLADGSPLRSVAAGEIRKLLRDEVFVDPQFRTTGIVVLGNGPEEIRIRQRVIEAPVFTDSRGNDVTKTRPQRRVVDWTLVLQDSSWLLFQLEVVGSHERVDR